MNAIEVNNIWKKFKKGEKLNSLREGIPSLLRDCFRSTNGRDQLAKEEFWALKNVSFRVPKGGVLGIIGPNGAGKSTLLNILASIITQTKGEYGFSGRLSAIIEVSTGFHPDFTGRENVFFNGAVLGMSRKEIAAKFDAIVDFSGIREFIDTPVKYYSTGMSARLGFAVAVHVDPDILLIDEVLSVGDMAFQAKCVRKMKELQRKGVTIIFISHNIALVSHLCERVLLLDKGGVIKDGEPGVVIPFYEDLMAEREESELREELEDSTDQTEAQDHYSGKITDINFIDKKNKDKDVILTDEPISIKIDYDIHAEIRDPVFVLEIVRMDGVVCCDSNTRDHYAGISHLFGKGSVGVVLESTRLVPDMYYARVSVLDRNFLHPFVATRKKVFKVDSTAKDSAFESIFFAETKWSVSQFPNK